MRCVVDTNVLVSGVILSSSVPRQAVSKALRTDVVLFSEDTMNELAEVLLRSKFDQYASREERTRFLAELGAVAEFVPIIQVVCECRDPKDDKFLQVALNGRADCIITGDADLLGMNPWRGIAVVAAADYLRR